VSAGAEEDVREVARRVIASGRAERRSYFGGANEIAAWDLGVGCEGEVEILIEPVGDDRAGERALAAGSAVIAADRARARRTAAGEAARQVGIAVPTRAWLDTPQSRLTHRTDANCSSTCSCRHHAC
jgi:xanthine/CO dehydrogenase XdhC/CoxF family maturation factor